MNHIYRSIWSVALATWVAVSENTKSKGKCSSLRTQLLAVSLIFCTSTGWALPTGQQVAAGQVNISTPHAGQMQINQGSLQAIVNWQGFSINPNESVNIQQPNVNAILLNRVVGIDASVIQGQLNANGQVYLINPNGVLFSKTAQVDVGSLVASTHNLSDADFLSGKYHFVQDTVQGIVSNQGYIKTPEGGVVALIGTQVSNEGKIETPKGTTVLAAGKTVDLDFKGDGLVEVKVPEAALNALVTNKGAIHADGGRIVLTAKAAGQLVGTVLNSEGLLQAQSLVARNGEIILDGGDTGLTQVSGTLDVSGQQAGGKITVSGEKVQIAESANLDARTLSSGKAGTIKVLANMDHGVVNIAGKLDASAPTQGDGGFIETSAAKVKVADTAKISTKAANGKIGQWLIDPFDFTIAAIGGDITGASLSAMLGLNSVFISTVNGVNSATNLYATTAGKGDIFVNDAVTWLANKLTLSAERNIYINDNLNGSGTAQLALEYGQGVAEAGNTSDYIINYTGNTFSNPAINLPAGDNFSTKLGSDGVVKTYTVITRLGLAGSTTGTDLQGMYGDLSKNYALGKNILADSPFDTNSLNDTSTWNSGAGFLPIGNAATPFTGSFAGLGHAIGFLNIKRPKTDNVGLFGYTGAGSAIRDIGLIGGSVVGQNNVGGLVGNFSGWNNTINNAYSSITVTGADIVGGLVGYNGYTDISTGNISNSYATGDVKGADTVGGLVGYNNGIISDVHAEGNATGSGNQIGGLVGRNDSGTVNNAYATGNVTGADDVGGLAGVNYKIINNAYATGTIKGSNKVGGLVGENNKDVSNAYATGDVIGDDGSGDIGGLVGYNTGNINIAYATGRVKNGDRVGGLVGFNETTTTAAGIINNAYATGSVSGSTYKIGGLVGLNYGTINNAYATGSVNGVGATYIGGLVGFNSGPVNNSFWDTQTTGQATSAGGTGKTSAQMKQLATFAGWDIDDKGGSPTVWRIYEGHTSPLLRQGLTLLTITPDSINKTYNGVAVNALRNAKFSILDAPTSGHLLNLANPYNNAINVGTYTATGLYSDQQGYDIKVVGGGLNIAPAPLSINANNIGKTYGQTYSFAGTEFTSIGLQNGETIDALTLASAGAAPTAHVIGSPYEITPSNAAGGTFNHNNYAITYKPGKLTVNPAPLDIVVGSYSKTYGQLITFGTTISNDGLQNGETIGSVDLTSDGAAATAPVTDTGYVIKVSNASGGTFRPSDYRITYVDGTLDVKPAALTITSNNVTKTYDGTTAANGIAVAAGSSRLFGTDFLTGGNFAFTDKNAGSGKTVTVGGVTVNDGNGGRNYLVNYLNNTGSVINKANLTVSAADVTKTYDGTTAANTAAVAAGDSRLFGSDSLSGGKFAFTDKNVGINKTVTVDKVIINDGNGGKNYTVNYLDNVHSKIDKANLILSANDVTKTYDGTTNAIGTAIVAGESRLFGSDSLSGGKFAFTDKNAGINKTVTVGNVTINDGNNGGNYLISYQNNNNSIIKPALLAITANNANKLYDGLAFSGGNGVSYTGFVNHEGSSVLSGILNYSGNSQGAIKTGNYEIIPSGLKSRNYNITYRNGILNIANSPVKPIRPVDDHDDVQDNISGLVTKATGDDRDIRTSIRETSESSTTSDRDHELTSDIADDFTGTQLTNNSLNDNRLLYSISGEKDKTKLIQPTLQIKNSAGRVKHLQLSTNRQFLSLLLEDGSVRVWDFQRGLQRRINTQETTRQVLTEIGGADDKGELLSIASKAGIGAYDLISSSTEGTIKASDISHFVTSSDARLLLMNAGADDLSAWDNTQNKKQWQIAYPRGAVNSLAISQNKHYAAVLSNQAGSYLLPANLQLKSLTDAVNLIDMRSGKVIKSLPNLGEHVVYMQFKDNTTLQLGLASGEMLEWAIAGGTPETVASFAEPITAVDISNQKYAYLLKDGTVRVGDGHGNVQLSIQNKENPFQYALLLEEGKKLLTVMASGDLALWDVASGKKMLRLFSTLQGWTVMDAFGRFDGSEESFENFTWLANEENIPLDSFSENYYEPGLLANVLQNQDYLNSNPDVVREGISLPPKVALQLAEQQGDAEKVALQLDLYDRGGGIDEIKIYHNDRLLSDENQLLAQQTPQQDSTGHRVLTFSITPSAGKNTLKVIASNKMGIENSSNELSFDGKSKAYTASIKLLTVGIDRYSDAKLKLDYSVADADSIALAIKNNAKITASKSLTNENATKPKILAELKELSQGTQQDVLVIYFAGHGLAVGKEWYFLPYETKMQPTLEKIAASGISATELSDIFKKSKIQHILLMVDSCYSGAGMDAFSKLQNGQRYFTRQLSRSLGITVLTAAAKNQQAAELKSLGHGLFTYLMTQELEKKEVSEPVTAHSVAESIVKDLPVLSKKIIGSIQEPVAYTHGNDFVLTNDLKKTGTAGVIKQ